MSSNISPTHPVPLFYRILFHHFEPYMAIMGVGQILLTPKSYIDVISPRLASLLERVSLGSESDMQSLYTHIACGWLMIIFNDLITLRAFEYDMKVWWYVLASHLVSDIMYTYALIQGLGNEPWDVSSWTQIGWFTFVITILPLFAKVAFLFGIGVDRSPMDGKKLRSKDN